MVEQSEPRFSDFYGESLAEYDCYNPMVPIEVGPDEIMEMSIQRGFRVLVMQVEGVENRRIIHVEPGGPLSGVGFCEHDGRLYINKNSSRYTTNIFLTNGPLARREGSVDDAGI